MPTKIETKAAGFTAVEMGIIQHGDMLGGDLGSRVARALEAPIGEQGVGVKALTWEPVPDGVYVGEACRAESVVGTYLAQEGTSYFNDELIGEDGETMPDGKAIAQADFTRRILSVLSPERKEPVAYARVYDKAKPHYDDIVSPNSQEAEMWAYDLIPLYAGQPT